MHEISSWIGDGVEDTRLSVLQVLLRAIVIFTATLLIVRIGSKRFFARKTAFDYVLGLMIASMMARSINGSQRLVPTIAAGFLLVTLHRLLAAIAYHSPAFGKLIKGNSETLVEEAEPKRDMMRRQCITKEDLAEAMRLKGVDSLEKVKLARLERSGEVSVVTKE
jgi:uncharacterized membrane protein YcaP (DUF421 family)